MTESNEFEAWLASRPQIIQDLGKKYPPGEYQMSENAPYGITCPGTIVYLNGYSENGDVIVVLKPDNMRPEGIEHSNRLMHPQGRDHSEIAKKAISAHVDPQYLIPYKRADS